MALPVAFPAVGLAYNHPNDTVDLPTAHPFNTIFSRMGTANAAAGTHDYPIMLLQGLAFALARCNPNNAGELDTMLYGVHAIDLPAVLATLETAINNGFVLGLVFGLTPLPCGFDVIRKAQVWAQANSNLLRDLMAADFYAVPAVAGNPVQLRMSFSLLVEPSNLLLRAAAEIICLSGYVHAPFSRTAGSRYAQFFALVVDELGGPAAATPPDAVARAMLHSGLPPEISVYPEFLGERYPHALLRLHYVAGSFADRRAAFSNYVQLLDARFPPSDQFLH